MGKGQALPEAQLVFQKQALGFISSRWVFKVWRRGRLLHKHHGVWISRGHPGQEYIPAVLHHTLIAAVFVVPVLTDNRRVLTTRPHTSRLR